MSDLPPGRSWRRGGDVGAVGQLPAKVEGRHRWIALVTYVLTEGQAPALHSGARVVFDHENRLAVGVACYDCEQLYDRVTAKQPCPMAKS